MPSLFFFSFFKDYILASLWIGFILQTKEIYTNSTFDYAAYCGSQNCPRTKLPEATSKPTLNSIYALFGTLSASTLLSLFICLLFVDDLKFDENNKKMPRGKISLTLISMINFFSVPIMNFSKLFSFLKKAYFKVNWEVYTTC